MRCGAVFVAAWMGLSPSVVSAAWEFGAPVAVTGEARERVFHQLESAGRKNLAVSGQTVALTWTDNRTGVAQVYVALKALADERFEREWAVSSGGKAAYEPAVVPLGDGRFLLGWEEADGVWLRAAMPSGLGPPLRLSAAQSRQIALAPLGEAGTVAAWAQKAGDHARIVIARVRLDSATGAVHAEAPQPVEAAPPQQDQLYPSLAVRGANTVVVAWEDRRHGHTRLYYACSREGKGFTAPRGLNETSPSPSARFGRGGGVTRVALASAGDKGVAAAWMDKRDYQSGYDIYAAFMTGDCRFGANEKVQDQFADQTPQWHPAIAMLPGAEAVVAWDDTRDGDADIWLSWKASPGWSENLAVPDASGRGHQDNPVVALDAQGNLHLAWLERTQPGGPSKLMYMAGKSGK